MAAKNGTPASGSGQSLEQKVVLSGGAAVHGSSSRAGFLPLPLKRVPIGALEGIETYLRCREGVEAFTLYSTASQALKEEDRSRLLESGVEFLYIRMADHDRFRRQVDQKLVEVVSDPALAASERSALLYDTAVEMIDELLRDGKLPDRMPAVTRVCRAVTTFVMNEPEAFSHLFAASRHDFYTATHMVNVATWMVPLAYALGYRDGPVLEQVCEAGLVHDIGKMYVPEEVLNKRERLTDEEWGQIRMHPQLGYEHLRQCADVSSTALTVTLQHHERLDGSGYPARLKGDAIHPMSRICAVVDSFDAMTAFRPFKRMTMGVVDAITTLRREAPARYELRVVQVLQELLNGVRDVPVAAEEKESAGEGPGNQRRHERFAFMCPARVHILHRMGNQWLEGEGYQVTTHNISRSGLGFLCQRPIRVDEMVRIRLLGLDPAKRVRRVLEGRTARCRGYPDGWHDIGVEFAKAA